MNINDNAVKEGKWYTDKDGDFCDKKSSGMKQMHACGPLELICVFDFERYEPKNSIIRFLCKTKWLHNLIARLMGYEYSISMNDYCKITRKFVNCDSDLAQRCIVAMVNYGMCNLNEAIRIWAMACERCRNVLVQRFLDEDKREGFGYEERSSKWFESRARCSFCNGMIEITDLDLDSKDKTPIKEKITQSDDEIIDIEDAKHLMELIINKGIVGCGHCNTKFEEDDFAFSYETGHCQYCRNLMTKGLVNSFKIEN